MTFLTVQDLDNFELLVNHCKNYKEYMKLRYSDGSWWVSIIRPPMLPIRCEGATFAVAVQLATEAVLREYPDEAVAEALKHPLPGFGGIGLHAEMRKAADRVVDENTAGLQGVPPEALLRRTGMHAAAAEARRLQNDTAGDRYAAERKAWRESQEYPDVSGGGVPYSPKTPGMHTDVELKSARDEGFCGGIGDHIDLSDN